MHKIHPQKKIVYKIHLQKKKKCTKKIPRNNIAQNSSAKKSAQKKFKEKNGAQNSSPKKK